MPIRPEHRSAEWRVALGAGAPREAAAQRCELVAELADLGLLLFNSNEFVYLY